MSHPSSVDCRFCGAKAGSECVTASGKPFIGYHNSRIKVAERAVATPMSAAAEVLNAAKAWREAQAALAKAVDAYVSATTMPKPLDDISLGKVVDALRATMGGA